MTTPLTPLNDLTPLDNGEFCADGSCELPSTASQADNNAEPVIQYQEDGFLPAPPFDTPPF